MVIYVVIVVKWIYCITYPQRSLNMFITIDHSRQPDIIHAIRTGDTAEVTLKEFRPKVTIIITEVTAAGISGTLDHGNQSFRRYYGFGQLEKNTGVYFAEWSQVDRVYMKGES